MNKEDFKQYLEDTNLIKSTDNLTGYKYVLLSVFIALMGEYSPKTKEVENELDWLEIKDDTIYIKSEVFTITSKLRSVGCISIKQLNGFNVIKLNDAFKDFSNKAMFNNELYYKLFKSSGTWELKFMYYLMMSISANYSLKFIYEYLDDKIGDVLINLVK